MLHFFLAAAKIGIFCVIIEHFNTNCCMAFN